MITEFKEKSGASRFAACLGKSTLQKDEIAWKEIEKIADILISENFGIIHGAYAGGAMQAINDGAEKSIKKQNKNNFLNIGVPFEIFEKEWPRVSYGVFLNPAKTLSERVDNIILNSDIVVVLPKGGFGTLAELIFAFHLNQIQEEVNGQIRPIIFYGEKWKFLMKEICKNLDLNGQSIGDKWCFHANSVHDFQEIIKKLK